MNKKILSAGLLSAMIFASANANAFYVGAGVGSSKAKVDGDTYDKETAFTVSAGMSIPLPLIPIRGEVELLNLKSGDDEVEGKIYGAAANAYVGLPLLPIVKPYVGMGLAYSQMKYSDTSIPFSGKSEWKVRPQYMIGLDLDLPLIPIAGGIEYRYMDTSFGGKDFPTDVDTKVHTVLVKGRVYF